VSDARLVRERLQKISAELLRLDESWMNMKIGSMSAFDPRQPWQPWQPWQPAEIRGGSDFAGLIQVGGSRKRGLQLKRCGKYCAET